MFFKAAHIEADFWIGFSLPMASTTQQHLSSTDADWLSFGPFRLSMVARLLERDGEPVSIGGRAFDILTALVSEAGQVVDKRALMARVWPNISVDEGSLRVHLVSLRKALGDGEDGARYITNVPGRGYCWVAPLMAQARAREQEPVPAVAAAPVALPATAAALPLPPRPARMIGREQVLAQIAEALEQHRFVSVVGPGGIGKTTVALAAAHDHAAALGHDVHFVDLAGLSDPHLVDGLTASAIGLQVHSTNALALLTAHFRDRPALVVFDNCEHLVDAVAGLAETLWGAAPDLRLLTTSREPLRAEGEFVHRLPALDCPPQDAPIDAEALVAFPAARLFVERMATGGQAVALTDDEVVQVAGICRKLDGIPLAIELAAGRAESYGVAGIAALLEKRFNLLWHGRRTAVARQQTMNAAIGWSYNLLGETEQRAARRLAAFAGPFTLEAAQDVAAGDDLPRPLVVGAVGELVAKSLLHMEKTPGGARYRLLETTKAYLADRLTESGEADRVANAHAQAMIETLTRPASDPGRDLADLRSALEWAFSEAGDPATAIALSAATSDRFLEMGLLAECRIWCERGLALLPEAERSDRKTLRLATALGLSWMYTVGNGDDVRGIFTRGLELAEALNDHDYQLRLLSGLHTLLTRRADFRGALEVARRADQVAKQLGTVEARAMADAMQAMALHQMAEHCAAEILYDGARQAPGVSPRDEVVRFGFPHRMTCLVGWARALTLSGRPESGRRQLMDALALAESLDHPLALCVTSIWGLPLLIWLEDWEAAQAMIERLMTVAERHSLAPHIAAGRGLLGEIMVRRGQAAAGLPLLQSSLQVLRGERHAMLETPLNIAQSLGLSGVGRHEEALALLAETNEGMQLRGDLMHAPDLLLTKGRIRHDMGLLHQAETCFAAALERGTEHKLLAFRLKAAIGLAEVWRATGRGGEVPALLTPLLQAHHEGLDMTVPRRARDLIAGA